MMVLSHNFNNKEIEQERFIEAFNISSIKNKTLINIYDGNRRKELKELIEEIMK